MVTELAKEREWNGVFQRGGGAATEEQSDLCHGIPATELEAPGFLEGSRAGEVINWSYVSFFNFYLFIFIFGCVGSSFLCEGFL